MAEEQLAPTEGAEALNAAPETAEETATRSIEEFARERGWRPKDEFEGNEADWRDAEGFLSFGLDRTRDLSRDVKSLREDMGRMSRTSADMAEQAADRARKEERSTWEARHTRAVEEGDLATATQAVTKIAELSVQPIKTPDNDPSVARFVSDNAWFNHDPAAKMVAITKADQIAATGGTVEEQLRAAKDEVHRRFPEYAPAQAKPAPSVANPGARVADNRGRKKGFNDMPAEAQQACRELVRRGLASQDGYVLNYYDQGAS